MPNGGIGIGTGILETAGNVALGEQQYQQEQELMDIHHQNQQQLNQQGADLQYDMWKKTSYPAQVRMMEKAGLNPALMYKGAGPSGQTGSQTGGAASKGNAPQRPQINPQTMMMGIQAKMMQKQIEGIEETNEGLRIDNAIKRGDDTAGRGQLEIDLQTTQKEREEIERDLKKLDKDFFMKNDIAPSEYAIIGAIKSGAGDAEKIIREIVNMTPEERQKKLLGEKYEPQNPFELIREWELKTGKEYDGSKENIDKIKGLREAYERAGFEIQ